MINVGVHMQSAVKGYADARYDLFIRLIGIIEPCWKVVSEFADKAELPMKEHTL